MRETAPLLPSSSPDSPGSLFHPFPDFIPPDHYPFFHPSHPFHESWKFWVWTIIAVPLVVVKLLCFSFVLLWGTIVATIFLFLDHPTRLEPHVKRNSYQARLFYLRRWFTQVAFRQFIFCAGVVFLNVRGKRDTRAVTIVANHVSYMDFFALFAVLGTACFVAKKEMRDALWLGYFAEHTMSCIFVDQRTSTPVVTPDMADERDRADYEGNGTVRKEKEILQGSHSGEILVTMGDSNSHSAPRENVPFTGNAELIAACQRKLSDNSAISTADTEPIIIFPEGTTTNGLGLLDFRTGAFVSGLPVQPVCIHYARFPRVSLSWESIPLYTQLWRVLAWPFHSMEIEFLPIYFPNAEEQTNPKVYARGVQQQMGRALKLPRLSLSLGDKKRFHNCIIRGDISWDEYAKRIRQTENF